MKTATQPRVSSLLPSGFCRVSICGKGRIEFRPDWSYSKPWMIFLNGNQLASFASCEAAENRLTKTYFLKFSS